MFGLAFIEPPENQQEEEMPLNKDSEDVIQNQKHCQRVLELAVRSKGVIIARFSQASESMTALLRTNKKARLGICKGLVNRWMARHANDGSIWNDIFNEDGNIKIEEIHKLIQESVALCHLSLSQRMRNVFAQGYNSAMYLARYGLVQRRDIVGQYRLTSRGGVGDRPANTLGIRIALQITNGARNGYKVITVYGDSEPHVFCAWVGGPIRGTINDIAVFDPNFGEVWFDQIRRFEIWLACSWTEFYGDSYDTFVIEDWGLVPLDRMNRLVPRFL